MKYIFDDKDIIPLMEKIPTKKLICLRDFAERLKIYITSNINIPDEEETVGNFKDTIRKGNGQSRLGEILTAAKEFKPLRTEISKRNLKLQLPENIDLSGNDESHNEEMHNITMEYQQKGLRGNFLKAIFDITNKAIYEFNYPGKVKEL